MKRIVVIIMVLIFCIGLSAQDYKSYIKRYDTTVTLDSTESMVLYIPWPAPDFKFVSDDKGIYTSLDSLSAPAIYDVYSSTGNMFIHVIPEYINAEENDSLSTYMHPLTYDPNKEKWYTSENDSTFLDFGKGIYTSGSENWQSWVNEKCYTLELTGETWSCAGVALTLKQAASNTTDADTKFYIVVYIRR